jgi:hypothetical protein
MLHPLLLDLLVYFFILQGNPAASVFFTIYFKLMLVCLKRHLRGASSWGPFKRPSLAPWTGLNWERTTITVYTIADELCQAFEVVFGAILNHNRKMVVLGLGSWASHHDWLLPW